MADDKNLDPMDLRNLTFVDFSKVPPGGWPDPPEWDEDPGYDTEMKRINTKIYNCLWIIPSGTGAMSHMQRLYARIRMLLGIDNEKDAVRTWREMGYRSERIAGLLVADAIANGTWQELPDELQERARV